MNCRCLMSIVVALAVCVPFPATAAPPSPAPAAAVDAPGEKIPSVGVDALMKAPDKYQGTVRLRGVVSAVFPKEQQLGLIDAIYLNCCSTASCAQALPVKWTGEMPPTKILVIVTGEIQRSGEKLEFVAKSIEKPKSAATPTP